MTAAVAAMMTAGVLGSIGVASAAGSGSAPVTVTNPTNLPVPVNGSVSVSNLPATQPISGSVSVTNLPATQPISGSVSVSNFPETQPISGSVNIGTMPAVRSGDRTVQVNSGPLLSYFSEATGRTTGRLDVSPYRTIRVQATTNCSSGGTSQIVIYTSVNNGQVFLDSVSVSGQARINQTYEVPGYEIEVLLVCGNSTFVSGDAAVWGHA